MMNEAPAVPSVPLTLIAEFARHLAAHATATRALALWCAARLDADGASVQADVLSDSPAASWPGGLQPGGGAVRHRRVRLMWGATMVSEAENWYLPDRLPAAMQSALRSGTIPFGGLVAPLRPRRIALQAVPLAAGCALHVTALVDTPARGVIAAVSERYPASLMHPRRGRTG